MAAAALIAGSAISAYGSYEGGVQKQDAYNLQARQKRATAAEVQIGADREIQLSKQAFERTRAAQITSFGKSGVDVGSGSPLAMLEQSASNAFDQQQSIRQAADYRSSTLSEDAIQSETLGKQAYDAGVLGMLGAGLKGFSKDPYSYDSGVTNASAGQGNQPNDDSILTGDSYAPTTYYGTRDYRRSGGNL